ncbi:hypothetical protein TVAG_514020 [Trichomonas vaginalis G3]|uniref:GH18 domain-containing protein n=1 Tax=Trichomonas vaginalis (strain ATCC PRA-98 / G3) TaxID=412133 RepID=A2GIN7_TRIV3|nr:glycosidases domain-containing protein [Trichomonas vaginalis G3]EAX82980.1 hypothetical protein TVAG_514020 [Trichomonas vaginalis G3]KAI5552119.1 glycosidases domain-containing protein [Trichomonas vaginalis G3]|eukprot:XP_001295910.1 hypothetical protein [Trichomonas vaginalis G3]
MSTLDLSISEDNGHQRNDDSLLNDKSTIACIVINVILIFTMLLIIILFFSLFSAKSQNENKRPYLCINSKSETNKDCFGGWFYKGYDKSTSPAKNAQWASDHNWNYVLFSTDITTDERKQQTLENIREFKKKKISFHIMCLEDTIFIEKHDSALKSIDALLDFFEKNNEFPDGIHIDVEPHALYHVGTPEFNECFQKWLDLLTKIRARLNKYPDLLFSAAVAYWYGVKTDDGNITNGHGYDMVNDKRLHSMMPMIYDGAGGTADKVYNRAKYYLQDRSNIVIGLDPKEYESVEQMRKVAQEVSERFAKNGTETSKHLWGFSIFSNTRY